MACLLVSATLVATGQLGSGALADGAGDALSAPDRVFYEGCQNLPVTYSVPTADGSTGWDLELQVGNGHEVVGQLDLDSATDPASGTVPVPICNDVGAAAGSYALTGDGLRYYPDRQSPFELVPGQVDLEPIPTTIALQRIRIRNRVGLAVHATQATMSGSTPLPYASFRLQLRRHGRWVGDNSGDHLIGARGAARLTRRRLGDLGRLRVVLEADRDHLRSVSNVVGPPAH